MIDLKELSKVSAVEAARQSLVQIQAKSEDGLLRAEAVVDTARHPDHPLHKYFTWDDSAAAEQWRMMQARQLIRKVLVTTPNGDDEESQVPKYVSLRSDRNKPGGGYRQTKEVINNAELLKELEETAKKDLEGVLARYNMLETLCEKVRKAAGIKPKPKK